MSRRTTEARLIQEYEAMATEFGFFEKDTDTGFNLPLEVSARHRIGMVRQRLKDDAADLSGMSWDYAESGQATMTFLGEETSYFVPPDIFLVGEAITQGRTVKFFKKFVSHPFYQLGRK